MNLLIEEWIPVRPLPTGAMKKIALKELLCGNEAWELCLPRDDMELAAVQLLICMTQALLTPKNPEEWQRRIAKPLSGPDYDAAIKPFGDWFQLDHPKHPFMQVHGVSAKIVTPMDKLFAGLTGSENCCFVNEPNLVSQLCGGCAAIALFNQASCSPSFGGGIDGGFKNGLRGSSPITTLVQGKHLRQTVWLNILYEEPLHHLIHWHKDTKLQKPTWIEPIKKSETIKAQQIGFLRGLFWQPAHVELLPPEAASQCACCGLGTDHAYRGFYKAQFGFNVTGTWPHPHSPRIMDGKKGDEKFVSFRYSAPSWTQLSRFVVQQQIDATIIEGQQPAAVVLQMREVMKTNAGKLHLLVGGYRNNQAKILERCHDVFTLNHGWDSNTSVINYLVQQGMGYKDALYSAISLFMNGKDAKKGGKSKKPLKGTGAKIKLNQLAVAQFYRRSEPTVESTLADIDFLAPEKELSRMRMALRKVAGDIFDEATQPYKDNPELIRTLAVSKLLLRKKLNDLEPQQNKGGDNGTTETP